MGAINLNLMRRPANWIKVFLMVFIAVSAIHIVQKRAGS